MKLYGFYSEKQAKSGGVGKYKLPDGRVVKVSETTTTGKPAGYWDDYISLGELVSLVEEFPLRQTMKAAKPIKSNIEINFLDYLDAPGQLVSDIAAQIGNGDKNFAKIVVLEGFVAMTIHAELNLEDVYKVCSKIGFTNEQVAKEVVRQNKNKTQKHFMN